MNELRFEFCGAALCALPSGGLWWPDAQMLCVSDLHLGKSERLARRGGGLLPPYEVAQTLETLGADIDRCAPKTVVCLGDSFDDAHAAETLSAADAQRLAQMMNGRDWIWIEGNHDPGPVGLGGETRAELNLSPLTFRHIAAAQPTAEVSGHYHPKITVKLRGHRITRRCFLLGPNRMILPAYGAYTGGLDARRAPLSELVQPPSRAILLGTPPVALPLDPPR